MSRSTGWVPGLWLDIFDMLLDEYEELNYGDSWNLNFNYNLTDTLNQAEKERGWKISCHRARGNFQCGSCQKTWSSARGMVLFHYRLRGGRGTVILRPFRQSCCRCPEKFELPGFSRDEVENVLCKLFRKIRKNIYNDNDGGDGGAPPDNFRRWTKPHETSLCEACREGICLQKEEDANEVCD